MTVTVSILHAEGRRISRVIAMNSHVLTGASGENGPYVQRHAGVEAENGTDSVLEWDVKDETGMVRTAILFLAHCGDPGIHGLTVQKHVAVELKAEEGPVLH